MLIPDFRFMTGLRTIVVASALLAGTAACPASEQVGAGSRNSPSGFSSGLLLAQSGDVEIYYDGRGRQVIVDAYTGEILAIRPRGGRELNRPKRRPAHPERYYLDDPEDMERLRRDQSGMDEYTEAYPAYPGDGFPDAPEDDLGGWTDPVERSARGEGLTLPDEQSEILVEPGNPATIEPPVTSAARKEVAELQVLLDRKAASPGVIDGHFGSNVDKGLAVYGEVTGVVLRSTDAAGIKKALADSGGDAFVDYTI